jgi:hypothetical protein
MSDLKAAAQQALEALETCDAEHPSDGGRQWYDAALVEPAITALKAALEQPEQAELDAYSYASRLAIAIWEKHYKATAVNWKPLPDLMGVVSQIDNMTAGLTHQQAQPEQDVPEKDCGNMEPVAWLESPYGSIRMNTAMRFQFPPQSLKWKIPLFTHPPRREWRGLTDEEIEDCWDGYLSDYQLQMIRTIEDKLKERNA